MSAKPTPGPWTFGIVAYSGDDMQESFIEPKPFDYRGEDYVNHPSIYGPDGEPIVDCGGEYYLFSGPADARLLTAAPDLLAALQAAVADFKQAKYVDDLQFDWIDNARAAIDKALGKQ